MVAHTRNAKDSQPIVQVSAGERAELEALLRRVGSSPIVPLDLSAQQLILALSPSKGNARLMLAVLLMHADALGNVAAHIAELAALAAIQPDTAKVLLRKLRRSGELTIYRPGAFRRPTIWHIAAVKVA